MDGGRRARICGRQIRRLSLEIYAVQEVCPASIVCLPCPQVATVAATFSREWVVELVRKELDLPLAQRIRQGGWKPTGRGGAGRAGLPKGRGERFGPNHGGSSMPLASIIHTNLGRAPLSQGRHAAQRRKAAYGYSNLELDLQIRATGIQAGSAWSRCCGSSPERSRLIAVNNNASAVLLGLLGAGLRARGHSLPRGGRRDRRRVPGPRRAAPERSDAGRRGDHQPHLSAGLRGGHHRGARPLT